MQMEIDRRPMCSIPSMFNLVARRPLGRYVVACGVALWTLAGLVILGWIYNIGVLLSVVPGLTVMNPLTAINFFLCGAALLLFLFSGPTMSWARYGGGACAWLVTLTAIWRLAAYNGAWDWSPDKLLFRAKLPLYSSKMAPNTAFNFLLEGAALGLLNGAGKIGKRVAQYLALGAALIAFMALAGYAYRANELTQLSGFVAMALHTAIAFVVLSTAILSLRPNEGLARALIGKELGGVMARRVLPVAVVFIFLMGWLRLLGQRAGWYDTDLGTSLYAVSMIVMMIVLTWLSAYNLNLADLKRAHAEGKIKKLNEQLQSRADQLQIANKELEGFSYSVSHDLRAPLRAIEGFSRILIEDHLPQLNEEAQRCLGVISSNTRQMGQLIDDLLAFSRMSRQGMQVGRVDMAELAGSVLEELRRGEPERNVEIAVGELPPAQGDVAMIRQVWINLLSNALKFTRHKPDPRIVVEAETNGKEIAYRVKDNGAGFDMRYANKLFGVFQRLHGAQEFEGTGVGLALVQRIVQRHGGRVWGESEVDRGATFHFTLPKSNT